MTTVVVIFVMLAGGTYWYLRRSAKATQASKDEAVRITRADQNELMRKALGTRPPRLDD